MHPDSDEIMLTKALTKCLREHMLSTVQQVFQLASAPIYHAVRPVRNGLSRRFIKQLSCGACGATREIDPMHTGPQGLGVETCGIACLSGCRKCRREFDTNPGAFAEHHHRDIPNSIELFHHLWELKQRTIL
jgi:hypothetical protein